MDAHRPKTFSLHARRIVVEATPVEATPVEATPTTRALVLARRRSNSTHAHASRTFMRAFDTAHPSSMLESVAQRRRQA